MVPKAIMVKDIRQTGSYGSNPEHLINFKGMLYFSAEEEGCGNELWKSDGTQEGTMIAKDANPGTDNFYPRSLKVIGETLYFTDTTALWKSDGTEVGTVLVEKFSMFAPGDLTMIQGILYFGAETRLHGLELWRSDGTEAGTYMVKDINPGIESGINSTPLVVNDTLYFMADDGVHGFELWKSDGTEAGTVMVKDIKPGFDYSWPIYLEEMDGILYFSANDGIHGQELWRSDGTEVGTYMFKDTIEGPDGSYINPVNIDGTLFFGSAGGLWRSDGTEIGTVRLGEITLRSTLTVVIVNGMYYFIAYDGTHGSELWKSDGTEAGTVMVKDIRSGSYSSSPEDLIEVNGVLCFTANDGINGRELWKSDGTESGTLMVKDIRPGSYWSTPYSSESEDLMEVNGVLYFTAFDGTNGRELWKSDGTDTGTVMVKDIYPGSENFDVNSSSPSYLTEMNGILYFQANDGVHGKELWRSNGTEVGTYLVRDIKAPSSSPSDFEEMDGTLYFDAEDESHGRELWKSDGTQDGTILVKDIQPSEVSSYPKNLTKVNNIIFMSTEYFHGDGPFYNLSRRSELRKTDGTESGTVSIKGVDNDTLYHLGSFLSFNNKLYFCATDVSFSTSGESNTELWVSDGTEAGTYMVKDINPGITESSWPDYLTEVDGIVYFEAYDGTHGSELWKSDGTDTGTVMVKDIYPGSGTYYANNSSPSYLTEMDGILYFQADDGKHGRELWRSNGTEAGTYMVKDIYAGSEDCNADNLFDKNGILYFSADDGMHGQELWRSDGTEAGTYMVKDINPGPEDSNPSYFVEHNGILYFGADNGTDGHELWRSNGTKNGTSMLKDIHSGPGDSSPIYLIEFNGKLWFSANDGINGRELWASDGTEVNTAIIKDIAPGPRYSNPSSFIEVNGTLFFTADDGENGRELWSLKYALPADFEADGDVDMDDFAALCEHWLFQTFSADVAPYGGDGSVNLLDFANFSKSWEGTPANMFELGIYAEQWLQVGSTSAEITPFDIAPESNKDGLINLLDFAVFADQWLTLD